MIINIRIISDDNMNINKNKNKNTGIISLVRNNRREHKNVELLIFQKNILSS